MTLLKPIRLKFSGLQSYREEQEIDFENLGALGIFGVFGPTGGGKSTILDALTLALFGQVERAKNGTRGIMNQYENKVFVSFEFVLGSGRFLVERLFDRDKHDRDSVKSKNLRLVELAPEDKVLADKTKDVDAKISSLLGMSFEDFSRAVVLPQGKFDQFLKLTGGERAKMLEHIFFLERYGESLSKKVTDLERTLGHNIETTQKLAAQLGDASPENIARLAEELSRHRVTVRVKAEVRKKTELLLKEIEQTGEIHNEINITRKELLVLEGQKPTIERQKQLLDMAQKAEPLRTLLDQLEDLTRREASEREIHTTKQGEAAEVKHRTEKAVERLAKAKSGEGELNRLRELLPGIA
ncbi:MAG TPA: AAA family ATPase, partial [Verrucomicrobiae bacterium]|nr:AAA family ATPase [Verrucomicrobiae bacterium]